VTLARFQERFVRTLLAPELPAPPAFAVYRNTVMKGCIDALQANYPSVARLVGEEWFRAAAAGYARANPPRVPMLTEYGEGFAAFLESFPPAAGLPYLPAVARLDRLSTEAHIAPDEPVLRRLNGRRLRPHPAARWAWFPLPAYTIWGANRDEGGEGAEIIWRAEGALITRPRDAVQWIALDADEYRFLDACAQGDTLPDAVPFLARLLQAGAFADQP
jgi:Putative DNA-binding domain